MNVLLRVLGLTALLAASGCVQAEESAVSLTATNAWIRTPPPGSPVMAGYVELRNEGKREVRLSTLRSDAFGGIEIHEMRESSGGMMRMRPVPELVVQPGDAVALAPGGLHLMLFRPTRALSDGDKVTIDLVLQDREPLSVEFELRTDAP